MADCRITENRHSRQIPVFSVPASVTHGSPRVEEMSTMDKGEIECGVHTHGLLLGHKKG